MIKLIRIEFTYEDGTSTEIIDPRACLLFQSRCNTSGVLSGMEDHVLIAKAKNAKKLKSTK